MIEQESGSTLLTRRFMISGSNLTQVVVLSLMAILAFAIILIPNGRDDEIFNVYTVVTSVGFATLILIGVYEVKLGQGSYLEIMLYLVVGMVLRSHPDADTIWWRYYTMILLAFYVVMIVWNVLGGRFGIWHMIQAKLHLPRPHLPSLRRNRTHPEEDEELSVAKEDEERQ